MKRLETIASRNRLKSFALLIMALLVPIALVFSSLFIVQNYGSPVIRYVKYSISAGLLVCAALFSFMVKFRNRAIRSTSKAEAIAWITETLKSDDGRELFQKRLLKLKKIVHEMPDDDAGFGGSYIYAEAKSIPEAKYQVFLWARKLMD